jgi:micrococcal nuclease
MRKRIVAPLVIGLCMVAAAALLPRGVTEQGAAPGASVVGAVTRIYDGDTFEVAGVGTVRLIGVDAMDAYRQERTASQSERYGLAVERVEHWAGLATECAQDRLEGRRVRVLFGPERKDRYGRVLAYLRLYPAGAGEDYGLLMLRDGLAAANHGIDHPRREEYLEAEDRAQSVRKGMWQDARVHP